jgi:hypothetical protein
VFTCLDHSPGLHILVRACGDIGCSHHSHSPQPVELANFQHFRFQSQSPSAVNRSFLSLWYLTSEESQLRGTSNRCGVTAILHATCTNYTITLHEEGTSDRYLNPHQYNVSISVHEPTFTLHNNQAYPSRSLYFSLLLSSAASNLSITPNTFSSSSLRPTTCTATGKPAIFTAS